MNQRIRESKTEPADSASPMIVHMPVWKRLFDIVFSTIALVLLAPLLLAVAILIKLTSPGPILFRHDRFGSDGKPFQVWKFRSMHINQTSVAHRRHVEEMIRTEQQLSKMDNDDLLTPLGRLLRCTAIDELPQLINVLRGEMSLVGPRPDVIPIEAYEPWQRIRFQVTPGLTGLWQVSGKNQLNFNEMMELDAAYVAERSIWLDFKILLMTTPAIFQQVKEDYQPKITTHNSTEQK